MAAIRISIFISIALLLGFFIGRQTCIPPKVNPAELKPDTIFVEKAIPKYYTKIEKVSEKEKPDTIYVAEVDTTIDDAQIKVSFESLYPIPTGAFNISGIITPRLVFPSYDYYYALSVSSYLDGSIVYTADAGRYLFNYKNIKMGVGAFLEKYPDRWNGGLRLTIRGEF